jgi:YfiH family protein
MTPALPAEWIVPDWPAPARVRALMTTRAGGVSAAPFDSFNLGSRCGDDPAAVARNRASLRQFLPAQPMWLKQVHGAQPVDAAAMRTEAEADASYARSPDAVCAILVADCMPILLADRDGSAVAAAHAGWRGMSGGVIEATVRAMGAAPAELIAWLGPAIGPQHFEVGADVLEAFTRSDAGVVGAFKPYPGRDGKFLCDLYALARRRLTALGVTHIYGGGYCTVGETRFYSYRRDKTTGRMGAFIWLDA